jgi:hypothetical protein
VASSFGGMLEKMPIHVATTWTCECDLWACECDKWICEHDYCEHERIFLKYFCYIYKNILSIGQIAIYIDGTFQLLK